VDLKRFESLMAKAKPLPARERRAKLAEALSLWRGPALADLANEPALAVESARLDELRISALEQRIDADLELGAHEQLVPELEALVGEHPLRERLRGQLILALYRSGRQAEALETYRETRRVLVEELGIEPGAELRELERAILCQDPALVSAPQRQATRVEDEPPLDSSWRWPRSPLLLGAALLLLASAGAVVAFVVAGRSSKGLNGPPPAKAALPTFHPGAPASSSASSPTTAHKPPAKEAAPKSRPHHPPSRGAAKPVAHSAPRANSNPPASSPPPPPQPIKKEPAKRGWVYWLADDFTDPALNEDLWHQETIGKGIGASEQNGRLEESITSEAVADSEHGFEQRYVTNCELGGDFEAVVHFELITWPTANGLRMTLGAQFAREWLAVERAGGWQASPNEIYASNIVTNAWARTADTQGALRVRRRAGVLSVYYLTRGHWTKFGSRAASGPATLILTFNTAGDPTLWGGLASSGAFDNFDATADSVACHGSPLPPRKRRKHSSRAVVAR
jgi:hypothetical protein